MRGLIVKPEHFELICQGVKTQTRRLHKRPLKAGDLAILKHDWVREWQPVTVIRINESYTQRLGDMMEYDARCEGFGSLREFKDMWPRYSGVAWDTDLVVQVYEFRVET